MDTKNLLLQSIKDDFAVITRNKTESNRLLDLIGYLEDQDEDVCDAAQRTLTKIFLRFLNVKEMVQTKGDSPTVIEYRKWLATRYDTTKDLLVMLIAKGKTVKSQVLALNNTLRLLQTEGKYPIDLNTDEVPKKPYYPEIFLKMIVNALIDRDMANVIKHFEPMLEYDDNRFYTLKALSQLIKDHANIEVAANEVDHFVTNTFTLLTFIELPILEKKPKRRKTDKSGKKQKQKADMNGEEDGLIGENKLYCEPINDEWPKFVLEYEKIADYFAASWLHLLGLKIPNNLYRKILLRMDTKIMPHFKNPLMLSDFLVGSFDVGGSVSLLSLSSLFLLIQKCNLDYPEFYTKLYSMLEPNILRVKYRSKFFYWADIFMTSSHLPAYLVAAFVKRSSRLALTAPVDALTVLIPFIANMLIRHKSVVESLINRSNARNSTDDPFNNCEPNPKDSNAMESTLWELKTLQSHWHPSVASAANFINKSLPTIEYDLADVLDNNFSEMLDEMLDKEIKVNDSIDIDVQLADKITKRFFSLTAMS